ncbi:uncharacterized protein LOC133931064 [Phragmites australis]|uniref:uncharacterized protein LOC133931064 n=1 Tax=Phragmites australis TaxID=29695 RepID=UPI002D78269D|nr:uncharacterized protein LOC133931064 [Phragmites australis]
MLRSTTRKSHRMDRLWNLDAIMACSRLIWRRRDAMWQVFLEESLQRQGTWERFVWTSGNEEDELAVAEPCWFRRLRWQYSTIAATRSQWGAGAQPAGKWDLLCFG